MKTVPVSDLSNVMVTGNRAVVTVGGLVVRCEVQDEMIRLYPERSHLHAELLVRLGR